MFPVARLSALSLALALALTLAFAPTPAFATDALATPRPPWLEQKIDAFRKLPPFRPPRTILQARFKGQTVYYVSPACCDIPSELYDEGGTLLCYPDGGFAGGDGRCPAFTLIDNVQGAVWRDERKAGAGTGHAPAGK